LGAEFGVSFWVRAATTATATVVATADGLAGNGLAVSLNSTAVTVKVANGTNSSITFPASVGVNQWAHVVLSVNSSSGTADGGNGTVGCSSVLLVVNGAVVGQGALAACLLPASPAAPGLIVGSQLAGNLDHFRVWRGALALDEALREYRAFSLTVAAVGLPAGGSFTVTARNSNFSASLSGAGTVPNFFAAGEPVHVAVVNATADCVAFPAYFVGPTDHVQVDVICGDRGFRASVFALPTSPSLPTLRPAPGTTMYGSALLANLSLGDLSVTSTRSALVAQGRWPASAPGLYFLAEFSAYCTVGAASSVVIRSYVDDGAIVYLNGAVVANFWSSQTAANRDSAATAMPAGSAFFLRAVYFQRSGSGIIDFKVSLAGPAGPFAVLGAATANLTCVAAGGNAYLSLNAQGITEEYPLILDVSSLSRPTTRVHLTNAGALVPVLAGSGGWSVAVVSQPANGRVCASSPLAGAHPVMSANFTCAAPAGTPGVDVHFMPSLTKDAPRSASAGSSHYVVPSLDWVTEPIHGSLATLQGKGMLPRSVTTNTSLTMRMTARCVPAATGPYVFRVQADDEMVVRLNPAYPVFTSLLFSTATAFAYTNLTAAGPKNTRPVTLQAGVPVFLSVEYFQSTGEAYARVQVSSDNGATFSAVGAASAAFPCFAGDSRVGNGALRFHERCDDGNLSDFDGCTWEGLVEPGWTCSAAQGALSVCSRPADGVVQGPEQCDDANTVACDACSSKMRTPGCGDGDICAAEGCDDGNAASGDGCSSACAVEAGWACPAANTPCAPVCGDGLLRGAEACDDGNTLGGDGCRQDCTAVEADYFCPTAGSPCIKVAACGGSVVAGAVAAPAPAVITKVRSISVLVQNRHATAALEISAVSAVAGAPLVEAPTLTLCATNADRGMCPGWVTYVGAMTRAAFKAVIDPYPVSFPPRVLLPGESLEIVLAVAVSYLRIGMASTWGATALAQDSYIQIFEGFAEASTAMGSFNGKVYYTVRKSVLALTRAPVSVPEPAAGATTTVTLKAMRLTNTLFGAAGATVSEVPGTAAAGADYTFASAGTVLAWGPAASHLAAAAYAVTATILPDTDDTELSETFGISLVGATAGACLLVGAAAPGGYDASAVVTIEAPNSLLAVTTSPQAFQWSPAFGAAVTVYTVALPSNATSVSITPVAVDPSATLAVNAAPLAQGTAYVYPSPLVTGDNPLKVVIDVATASGSLPPKSYTLTLHRQSADATLADLNVHNLTLSPAFSPSTTSYTTPAVPFSTNSILVRATPASAAFSNLVVFPGFAVMTPGVDISVRLSVGVNTIKVTCYPEDLITLSTTTVLVNRTAAEATKTLSSIVFSGNGTLAPANFTPATTTYTYTVASGVTSVTATPTMAGLYSTQTVNWVDLASNTTSAPITLGAPASNTAVSITVIAESLSTNTYTFTVRRMGSDPSLSALALAGAGVTLSPAFAPTTTAYSATAPFRAATTTVTATSQATVVTSILATAAGNALTLTSGAASTSFSLSVGVNVVTVVVTAEDPAFVRTYNVTVTRLAANTVDTLASLAFSAAGSLSPVFSPTVTAYTFTVASAVSSLSVTPTLGSVLASQTVQGLAVPTGSASAPVALGSSSAPSDTTVTVEVTAESGTKRNYTISVHRKGSNSRLSSLGFSPTFGAALSFSPATTAYTVLVPHSTNSTTIAATAEAAVVTSLVGNPGSLALTSGVASTASIPLTVGSGNVLSVTVTAEDAAVVTTYTVTVTRSSSVSALSALTFAGIIVNQTFASSLTSYTAIVPFATSAVVVTATKADPTIASIVLNPGSVALASGVASVPIPLGVGALVTLTVVVTAQDPSFSTTYTLQYERQPEYGGNVYPLAYGPARGGTQLMIEASGLNTTYLYRCVFASGSLRAVNSAPLLPRNASMAACTTPAWPYPAGVTTIAIIDPNGNPLRAGTASVTPKFTFTEDVLSASPTVDLVPAVDVTVTIAGGGFDSAVSTYSCKMQNGTTVATSNTFTPLTSSLATCRFAAPATWVFAAAPTFVSGAIFAVFKDGAPVALVSPVPVTIMRTAPLAPPAPVLTNLTSFSVSLALPIVRLEHMGGDPVTKVILQRNGTEVFSHTSPLSLVSWTDERVAPETSLGYRLITQNSLGVSVAGEELQVRTPRSVPIVTCVTPRAGPATGGTLVTLRGIQLAGTTAVRLGPTFDCTLVSIEETVIVVIVAAPDAESLNVPLLFNLTCPLGSSTSALSYSYRPLPYITAVAPLWAPRLVPGLITISGTDLGSDPQDVADVTSCANVTWVSTSTVLCAPAPLPASVFFASTSVQLTTVAGGTSNIYDQNVTLGGVTLNAVTPARGSWTGGTRITLTSASYLAQSQGDIVNVEVGFSQPCAEITFVSTTQITCLTAETLTVGSVPVVVTSLSAGRSNIDVNFFYDRAPFTAAPPVVTAVLPSSTGIAGGVSIRILGTNLGTSAPDVLGVGLAGVACRAHSVVWVSKTELRCATPVVPGPRAGPVLLTTASGGPSFKGSPFAFEWPQPVVTAVRPRVSGDLGGTTLSIAGRWFLDAEPAAFIGGVRCASTTWVSLTMVLCVTPPKADFGATPPPYPDTTTFVVEAGGVRSAGLAVAFRYGLECAPACGWEAECVVNDAQTAASCQCHRFWTGAPECGVPIVSLVNTTAAELREDDQNVTAGARVALAQAPAGPVTVVLGVSDPEEAALVSADPATGELLLTFSPAEWAVPREVTLVGVADKRADGDKTVSLVVRRVESADPAYSGAVAPPLILTNRDAPPKLSSVSSLISALSGSNITLHGDNLYPTLSVRMISVDTGEPAGPCVIQEINTAGRLLSARQSSVGVVGVIRFTTPPVNRSAYYYVELANVNPEGGPNPLHSKAIWPEPVFYTDDCPVPGSYGRGNDCAPCPKGGYCPGGLRIRPLAGYWNPGEDSGFVGACTPAEACLDRGVCAVGYMGPYCGGTFTATRPPGSARRAPSSSSSRSTLSLLW
jgi:cysteine-rich repeat protein